MVESCMQKKPDSLKFDIHEQFEIPLKNIREERNFGDPHQKIIKIRTKDNSEFLFKGFLRYEKALQNLETAMRQRND